MQTNKTLTLGPRHRKGQTMMEYIVLVALLGVASLPIIKILGDTFRDRVSMAAHEIGGEDGDSAAKTILKPAASKVKKSMRDFYHD